MIDQTMPMVCLMQDWNFMLLYEKHLTSSQKNYYRIINSSTVGCKITVNYILQLLLHFCFHIYFHSIDILKKYK